MGAGLTDAKENVVIAAGDCAVTLLPRLGGKIASIQIPSDGGGSHQLIHPPLHPYRALNQTMAFEEGDAGGWDECLPSVAPCSVATPAGPANSATIPDHGDLWRLPWQMLASADDAITMRARCFSLPLEITRSLQISTTASGWRLQLLYSLSNLGATDVPWSWAAHPLFSCTEGDRIVLPPEVDSLRLEGSRGHRLGKKGDAVPWPIARAADGASSDLSRVSASTAATGDKLFAGPFAASEDATGSALQGWCALERPSIGCRITLRFDTALTPYLGLWICYGGWPEGDGPKQVCVALEPATAPVDSLAETGAWSRSLAPGQTAAWPMELEIERIPPLERLEKASS